MEETSSKQPSHSSKKIPLLIGVLVLLLLVIAGQAYLLFQKDVPKPIQKEEKGEPSIAKNPFQEKDFFSEMRALQRRIDRMFEQHFMSGFDSNLPQIHDEMGLYDFDIDLKETDTGFIISCDIPGLDKNQINVHLQGNVLTIEGERSQVNEQSENTWVSRERSYGSFSRSIALPASVDPNSVTAEYKEGVLRINVKKLQPDESTKTRIQVI